MRVTPTRALVGALLLTASTAFAQIDARMLRYPDVSANQIAFVYAGDIWAVAKQGGVAQRLSTPAGEEMFPRFSPDGRTLAFSADYDGNLDIYTMPVEGGLPVRVTHNPAPDRVIDWYPDGQQLLFATRMTSGKDRFNQFYRVSKDGGLPEKLPLPYGEFGMIAADGHRLAYMPISRDFRTWKRYRGGMAPDIWLFDLVSHTSKNLTDSVANDSQPMWYGDTMYFLSDRGEAMRANIWALDLKTNALRQVTHFEQYDIHFPAIGPTDIVFEAAGRLYRLELPSETLREVKVEVVTDRSTLRPRIVNVSDLVHGATVSPSAKRVIVEARGELFSVPAEHGPILDMTRTSGFAERNPSWSPDGKTVAYFSDESGEYELWLRPADSSGEARKVTSMGPGFRYDIFWSPDSTHVAFVDQAMNINLCDVATGNVIAIDKGLYLMESALRNFTLSWSADSRWLAWARAVGHRTGAVFLYDMTTKTRHQVTTGFYDAGAPVFDPDGKYLYLLTDRSFDPSYSSYDNTWIYANATTVAAVPLRTDVASPLTPRNDVEGKDEDASAKEGEKKAHDAKAKKGPKDGDGKADAEPAEKKAPEPVTIDLDGFEERLVELPLDPGNYRNLAAVSGKVLVLRRPRAGSADKQSTIVLWDLKEREEKSVLDDADGFAVSADGTKLLVMSNGKLALVDPAPKQKIDKPLRTAELEMSLDPVAEWRQIFNDAWRIERDYFYDPNMHGVDWPAMRERYGALLDDVVTREDLNYVIGELIAELSSSHSYRGGGDVEKGLERGVGLLGVDFALEQGAYQIARILDGAPWDSEVRSPLKEPGVKVRQGDWLLAVNGVPLDVSVDPWAAFQGLADKTVTLTVNDKPTMTGAHEILVKTLADDYRLRNLDWINHKRLMVEKATNGRVGYIYVPDTGLNGQKELARQYYGQYAAEGLIIDERFNSGGQIPDRFVELLARKVLAYWGVRDGHDWQWPPVSNGGPKAMLINGWSGSGGDCFPYFFREEKVGPLIGRRTWGGLIGISGSPDLVDGGRLTVPTFSFYDVNGKWTVEGHGVEPDIDVVDDPALMVDGGDPQLERAIQEVVKALETNPNSPPTREPNPIRSGR